MKVVISAAGTGGHINPGIAIANKIKEKEPMSKIIFIGTKNGLETDLVPRAGYELKTIEAYGLGKKITLQNIKGIIKTINGIGQAKKILKEFKPDIVIGTGGYICGPVFLAARKLKIPTVLHESNAFPGLAVKTLSKKANLTLVGFKEAKERLTKAKKVIVTGTPTKIRRLKLSAEDKLKIKKELNLNPDLKTVLIFGGSQGAMAINKATLDFIIENPNLEFQIMWAPGPKQYEIIQEELNRKGTEINKMKSVRVVPYIYNMEEALNMCDLVVSRSGAMTITEIAKVAKPAIFIPLPNVSQNHQEYNAKVLVNVGAAQIILNDELNSKILSAKIKEMMKDKAKLLEMGEKANTVSIDNVEEKIYEAIKKI